MLGTKPGAIEYFVGVSLVMKECSCCERGNEEEEQVEFFPHTSTPTAASKGALAPLSLNAFFLFSKSCTSSRVRWLFPEVIVRARRRTEEA